MREPYRHEPNHNIHKEVFIVICSLPLLIGVFAGYVYLIKTFILGD